MQYLNIPRSQQKLFLQEVKQRVGLTWEDLASLLDVSKSMVYFYANGRHRIPLCKYTLLCEKSRYTLDSLSIIDISNKPKDITLPEMCSELAEFIGIIMGDGHVSSKNYEVTITLDKYKDHDYVPHVAKLFTDLFTIQPVIHLTKNVARCRTYSKQLVNFLVNKCEIPAGNRMNRTQIPQSVRSDTKYITSFLRGLFDTDGSFHRHRVNSAAVEYISRDKRFLQEVGNILRELQFSVCVSGKSAYIYRKTHIHAFFNLILPANPKHQHKYRHFSTHGSVPKTVLL